MNPRSERRANVVAVFVLVAVVAAALFGAWRLTGSDILIRDCSFDEVAWADARQIGTSDERYYASEPLAEDLVKCDDLIYGAAVLEVRQLLGPPTSKANRFWFYEIGVPRPLSDYPGLEVKFGSDGRVQLVSIPGYFEP